MVGKESIRRPRIGTRSLVLMDVLIDKIPPRPRARLLDLNKENSAFLFSWSRIFRFGEKATEM
jgi:hypothetical protein